jgi:hypothetical protein
LRIDTWWKNVPRFLGNRDRLAVKITKTPQALVVGVADDDVVENFDFEKLAGSDEVAGDFDVRFRRS